jgi:hypothetical protein
MAAGRTVSATTATVLRMATSKMTGKWMARGEFDPYEPI